ncbi:ATP-dependent RNA helicase HrpB [Crateriforma conspicua]|uniref:ATP-dependent RNA helicase HrpB n=2 Tax=Crateriforma TaxID=2714592 RepID=A0A5C6FLT1_9PLAN|nr:ATP-dependent helicase HrpB [Crateriforma conspicua]TWU60992.1 ATP-dependent RNA helicase HrpB [Crateriforma conspicua]
MPLPIDEVLPRILSSIQAARPVVLKAPPGAGKTTGIPPVLLKEGIQQFGQILLIQPRRLAARSAARRIASTLGETVGDRIGYHVRFDRRTGTRTELVAMTPGMLLRRLNDDPLLDSVGCVLLDEFHERSLELDLCLGMLHRIRTTLRDDLRLVVMSATLDPDPIVDFLGEGDAVVSQGRSYPVDIRYRPMQSRQRTEDAVADLLPEVRDATDGDVLVFLPGVGEIKRASQRLAHLASSLGYEVAELYGDLSPEQQDRVLRPADRRKVVLSTNVAETSVTIPGVTAVIDGGQAKVMTFHAAVGLPRLQRQPISVASADQRAGRAGRTQPGIAYRLWPEAMNRSRPAYDVPESRRSDLCQTVLILSRWGEIDVASFPWIDPPPSKSVDQAKALLRQLGAIDQGGKMTSDGYRMSNMPLHPRLSKLIASANRWNVLWPACLTAAMLSERPSLANADSGSDSPNRSASGDASVSSGWAENDLADAVDRLQTLSNQKTQRSGVEAQIIRVARRLEKIARSNRDAAPAHDESAAKLPVGQRLARALLSAFPDRIARRRDTASAQGVMIGGRGVRLTPSSTVANSALFLCIDVDSGDTEAKVRSAVGIQLDWLDDERVSQVDEAEFDPSTESLVMRRRIYVQDLLISETPIKCVSNESTAEVLLGEYLKRYGWCPPDCHDSVNEFVARVEFLRSNTPELELPPIGREQIEPTLRMLCAQHIQLSSVVNASWIDFLRAVYTYEQLRQIDHNAPDSLTVPGGSQRKIDYSEADRPTMSVKPQELFGWTESPRLAMSRVALRFQLLAPNGRPQQLTDDLASFWKNTYPQVRKDLRGRYPKHHWPEDPLTAAATRNGLKPR